MKKLSDFDTAEATSKCCMAIRSMLLYYDRYEYIINEVEIFRNKLFNLKYESYKVQR